MKAHDFFTELLKNWPFKLMSVAAAVILYFSYQILSLDSKSFSVPLQVRQGGSFALIEQAPRFVRVNVRGKPDQISAVQKNDITAYIDTSSVTAEGVNSLPVKLDLKDYFTLMEPLDVQVKPSSLMLSFEQTAYKWLPIKPLFSGTMDEGYEIAAWTVEPENVKVVGPQSAVKAAATVFTSGIDVKNKTTSFKVPVKIETGSKLINLTDTHEAVVKIEIHTQTLTRTFTDLTVQPLNLNKNLKPIKAFEKISLTLSGTKAALSTFTPTDSIVQADFSEVDSPGRYSIPLRINIPDEFSVVNINPPVLEVELSINSGLPGFDSYEEDFSAYNTFQDLQTIENPFFYGAG